jgi:hypothetical protein
MLLSERGTEKFAAGNSDYADPPMKGVVINCVVGGSIAAS